MCCMQFQQEKPKEANITPAQDQKIALPRALAATGKGSRRACEELIREGRVKVNGSPGIIGMYVNSSAVLEVDGKKVGVEKKRTILLYKPVGVVTSVIDPHNTTVRSLVPVSERVYPAGRLDKDASGVVILTNDGLLSNKIMHPSQGVSKTYAVTLTRPLREFHVSKLRRGVFVDKEKVAVTNLWWDGREVRVTLHEGRKHIVKRLFRKLGFTVLGLTRTNIGLLGLGELKPGEWKDLTEREINLLSNSQSNVLPRQHRRI